MFNFYIDNNTFSNLVCYKKDDPFDKTNLDPLVFYLFYLKLLNTAYMIKFMIILILYYQKFNVASEKVLACNVS